MCIRDSLVVVDHAVESEFFLHSASCCSSYTLTQLTIGEHLDKCSCQRFCIARWNKQSFDSIANELRCTRNRCRNNGGSCAHRFEHNVRCAFDVRRKHEHIE